MAKHVFLSFVAEDLDRVNLFRGQARNKNSSLSFDDYSVRVPYTSTNADYIRSQIRAKIRQASVLICLIGKTTHTSPWVQWEINTAATEGKRLLGVRLHSGALGEATPASMVNHRARVLNWDIDAIVREIGP